MRRAEDRFSARELYKIAVGGMGIDPRYFLDEMSLDAFNLAYEGYNRSRQDSWEQTRLMSYYIARPNLKGNPTVKSFMPLQWDSQPKKSTRERFQRLKNKFDKIINHGR